MERVAGWIQGQDIRIFQFVNRHLQCRLLDLVMPRITHLGGATFNIMTTVLCILIFSGAVRHWAVEALIALTISHLIVRLLKSIYFRPRPYLTLADARTFPNPLQDYSFPSGHTTAIFSITGVWSIYLPALAGLLFPIACLVGISRMYLGLHYPTDCAIGALIGLASAFLAVHILPLPW